VLTVRLSAVRLLEAGVLPVPVAFVVLFVISLSQNDVSVQLQNRRDFREALGHRHLRRGDPARILSGESGRTMGQMLKLLAELVMHGLVR
jgi:hypothetical protein